MGDSTREQVQEVARSTWFRVTARSGYAASGLVQALVGVLAIQVALQVGDPSASQEGALRALARAPGGAVVVALVGVGGLALALWLVVDGILERGPDDARVWRVRLKTWGKAVAYGAVGVAALKQLLDVGEGSGELMRRSSSTLLSVPGGQVLLVVAGLAVIGFGAGFIHRGVAKRFLSTIEVPSGRAGTAVVLLGQVGYAARGAAIGVIGVLLVVAAVTTDAEAVRGLDGALHVFASLPFGRVVLIAIGAGWIASGVYSIARARLARLD